MIDSIYERIDKIDVGDGAQRLGDRRRRGMLFYNKLY